VRKEEIQIIAKSVRDFCVVVMIAAALTLLTMLLYKACLVADQIKLTLAQTQKLEADADLTINQVRGQLTAKGGVLDIAKATMLHVDRAAGEAAIASRQQRAYFDQLGQKSVAVLSEVQHTVTTLDTTIAGIRHDVQQTSQSANSVLGETRTAVSSLNQVIASPEVPASLKSLAESSQHVDQATASVADIAHTIDGKVSELAHPSRARRAFDYVMDAVRAGSSLGWLFK
jgi:uncharacterized protein YoxC